MLTIKSAASSCVLSSPEVSNCCERISYQLGSQFRTHRLNISLSSKPQTIKYSISTMSATKVQQQAYASIMRGIKEVNFEGSSIPCHLILSGDHAFPLVMNSSGKAQVAASLYGSGRIVVLCHETYLTTLPDLVENAVNWLRGDESDNMSVGIHTSVKRVADNLSKSSFQVKVMEDFSSDQGVGVYVTDAYSAEGNEKNIIAFMKAGGGVLIAGQAWHWSSKNPNANTLLQYWGNKVSGVAGVYFSNQYGKRERVSIGPEIPSWKAVEVCENFKEDLEILLKGVSEFDFQGGFLASEILVHGLLSFPIASNVDGQVFLAGGYYGKGRVIVAGHESLFKKEGMSGFWSNALHWVDQGRQEVVGIEPDYALNVLKQSGLNCEPSDFKPGLSVFVCTVWKEDHMKEMLEFVAEGGGLVIGGQVWTWASRTDLNYLTEFSGNKILNPMGFTLLKSNVSGGIYKAPDPSTAVKDSYHFRHILNRFVVTKNKEITPEEEKSLKALQNYCPFFLRTENHKCYSYQQIVSTLVELYKKTGLIQVSESSPAKTPKDHILLNIAADMYKVCPNQDEFLGIVIKDNSVLPTVKDQRINFSVNTGDGEEWVSTGLYLSPGMKTNMTIPADIVNKKWKVQISCQTDTLAHKELFRAPTVYVRFPVTSEAMQVHNLWGGLIYLIAPPHTQVTGVEVIVEEAVLAPYFKSGVTSLSDWPQLRTAPAPWAELEFENIIITVPSDVVRSLDHPDTLADLWDKIMRAVADLAAIPHKFQRKERIVCDVQISRGLMHSGYPVMGKTPKAKVLASMEETMKNGLWGPIHELGHNQQRSSWNFRPHTTEATCNLWSVYVHETVLNIAREEYRAASLTEEYRTGITEEYIQGGRKLEDWNTWVALETYLQLQEKFGWDPYKKVFAAYHTMENVPDDNEGKMNLFAVTFSQTVGMDLTGFFKSWGWPIKADTEKKLSNLPAWIDHPMVKYK